MFKFINRYFHDIEIAVESIFANKLKSMLTALGIIFGVAAVIAMLAIGKGAKEEIMEQMKMVGVNNILINPIIDESSSSSSDTEKQTKKYSRGLHMLDVEAIKDVIPSVQRISPEISFNSTAMLGGVKHTAKLLGVANDYFELYNLPLASGTFFNDYQEENGIQVCIIGANLRAKFFSKVDPIGQYIKFDGVWLKVIGVLQKTTVSLTGFEDQGVNVYNDNIYIPVQTMLLRFQNRELVNTKLVSGASSNVMVMGMMGGGGRSMIAASSSSASSNVETNYNQLDRIVVQVAETNQIDATTEILSRMLIRRHSTVKDFEITVPELLLKQQQRTQDIFNIVLGAIAAISLWSEVSYHEHHVRFGNGEDKGRYRYKNGYRGEKMALLLSIPRRSYSYKRWLAVLIESLGIILAKFRAVCRFTTSVSFSSVIISFGVSAAVGVIFGYSPAKNASEKDPIESLRYE